MLVISVTDSGIGIKDENKDKLFKLFGSIKDSKKKINTELLIGEEELSK